MPRTPAETPKKSGVRRTAKKSSAPKQQISIPMVLNYDGIACDLLPWFLKVVELLSKGGNHECVTKKNASPSHKKPVGKTKVSGPELNLSFLPVGKVSLKAGDLNAVPPPADLETKAPESEKTANVLRSRSNAKRKRSTGSQTEHGQGAKRIRLSRCKPTVKSSKNIPRRSRSCNDLFPSSAQSDTSMPSLRPAPAQHALDKLEAQLTLFMTTQRAAMESFHANGDGTHVIHTSTQHRPQINQMSRYHITYNFQDAWDEAVREMNSESSSQHLHIEPQTETFVTYLACPENETGNSSHIINHVRNSLDAIFQSEPFVTYESSNNDSINSAAKSPNNIFSHVRNNIRNPSNDNSNAGT